MDGFLSSIQSKSPVDVGDLQNMDTDSLQKAAEDFKPALGKVQSALSSSDPDCGEPPAQSQESEQGESDPSFLDKAKSTFSNAKTAIDPAKDTFKQGKTTFDKAKSTNIPSSLDELPATLNQAKSTFGDGKSTFDLGKSTYEQAKTGKKPEASTPVEASTSLEPAELAPDDLTQGAPENAESTLDQAKSLLKEPPTSLDQIPGSLKQAKSTFDSAKSAGDPAKATLEQAKGTFDQVKSTKIPTSFDEIPSSFEQAKSTAGQGKSAFDLGKSTLDQVQSGSGQKQALPDPDQLAPEEAQSVFSKAPSSFGALPGAQSADNDLQTTDLDAGTPEDPSFLDKAKDTFSNVKGAVDPAKATFKQGQHTFQKAKATKIPSSMDDFPSTLNQAKSTLGDGKNTFDLGKSTFDQARTGVKPEGPALREPQAALDKASVDKIPSSITPSKASLEQASGSADIAIEKAQATFAQAQATKIPSSLDDVPSSLKQAQSTIDQGKAVGEPAKASIERAQSSFEPMMSALPSSDSAPVKVRQKRGGSAHGGNRKSRPVSTISASSVSIKIDGKKTVDLTNQSDPLQSIDGARISRLCDDGKLLETYYEDVSTVYEGFRRGVRVSGDKNCLGRKPSSTTPYQWLTYNEVDRRSADFGAGLLAIGIKPSNDSRIGLYSQNRPEYHLADLGMLRHSMTCVPLYDTLGIEAGNFIVNQAELKVIVCDNNAKVKSLLDRRKELQVISVLIMVEAASDENKAMAQQLGVRILQFEDVENLGKENPAPDHPPKAEDICLICYTSGTTGTPKGAMINHKNFVACSSAAFKVLDTCGVGLGPDDVLISYLPLAHSYERVIECSILTVGGQIGFFQGDVKKLMDDIKELRPTLFPSVPRLLNRFYDKVMSGVNSSKIKKMLFNMALSSKSKEMKRGIVRNNSIWDKFVFKTVQGALGGRCRLITTGSAPISASVLNFLKCIVGCPILEGYGQTENGGVATLCLVGDTESGHVGAPLPCNMVKLADVPDMNYFSNNNKGEVCLKGGNVFKGYFRDPEKTKDALDADGWLHTGDVGEWTPAGTLRIIDRKKHIFKLAQGEYIAPEKIENVLVQSPYLAQVYVHGDSLQACLVAIVVLDPETIGPLASKLGLSGNVDELRQNDVLKTAILKDLSELAKKNGLSSLEQVRDIYINHELFSVENGLLTPTFKTKRNEIRQAFAPQIAAMYEKMTGTTPTS